MTTRVYIAGPYSSDPAGNTRRAIIEADRIWRIGFVPFVPHLTHFWDFIVPHHYEVWLEYDMHWLDACDCVLRLPGESPGADKEVAHAKAKGVPVFGTVEELRAHYGK